MQSVLQRRLRNFLDSTGLSVSALERQAGLKINVARNILRGQSRKPSAETLQALATVMNCTVSDLLGVNREDYPSELKKEANQSSLLEYPDILRDSLECILEVYKEKNYPLTVKQVLTALGEVYEYSVQKKPPQVDRDFVEWFAKKER